MAERAPSPLTLHAQSQPRKLAVIDDRPDGTLVRWTYAELESEANRLAHALLEAGVRPRDRVIWCGQNSPGIVRMTLAAGKIGVTAVPLNYRLTPEEAAYVVDNSDAVLAYADAEFAELLAALRPSAPKLRDVLIFDGEPGPGQRGADALLADCAATPPRVGDARASTMIYTSGTTGKPKGALRENLGDPGQTGALLELIGYRPDDVFITTGPLYHSGPGGFTSIALALGNSVVIQRRFDPEDWLRLVDRYRVSTTFSAPTPIRMVCRLPDPVKTRYDVSCVRRTIANAAPWSFALKEAYLRDFPDDSLFEVYGSTELGVNTILLPADQRRKPGSCGQLAPGVEIRLLDDDGNEITEPEVPGEIYVRSKSVFATYHKARDKYEEDRRGDFHTVGDVAYFDAEGYYYICDRKKDMIISGGMNIYPAEIEAALEAHRDVVDVAVFGIPSDDWGESVHAAVVVAPGRPLGEAEVIAFAREHLAGYKVPRSVSFLEEIPRTGSGKILKRALREPFWGDRERRVG